MLNSMKSIALFVLLAAPLAAQFDTAEVLGAVRDASGAAVTKAAVVLVNQDTGIQARTATDADCASRRNQAPQTLTSSLTTDYSDSIRINSV